MDGRMPPATPAHRRRTPGRAPHATAPALPTTRRSSRTRLRLLLLLLCLCCFSCFSPLQSADQSLPTVDRRARSLPPTGVTPRRPPEQLLLLPFPSPSQSLSLFIFYTDGLLAARLGTVVHDAALPAPPSPLPYLFSSPSSLSPPVLSTSFPSLNLMASLPASVAPPTVPASVAPPTVPAGPDGARAPPRHPPPCCSRGRCFPNQKRETEGEI